MSLTKHGDISSGLMGLDVDKNRLDRGQVCYRDKRKACDDCGNCDDVSVYASVAGKVVRINPADRGRYEHVFDTFRAAFFFEEG